jgi:peroxiredoxin Q/BCP
VAYFTASCDPYEGEKGNKAFAESLKLDSPILSDPDKKTAEAYGVVHEGRAFPERWTFYIDKDGVIKEIDKMVKAQQAGKDVVKKLEELGIAKKK